MSKSETTPPPSPEADKSAAPPEEIQGIVTTEATIITAPPEPSLSEELDRALAPEEAQIEVLFSDSEPEPETRDENGEAATEMTISEFAAENPDAEPEAPSFESPEARRISALTRLVAHARESHEALDRQLTVVRQAGQNARQDADALEQEMAGLKEQLLKVKEGADAARKLYEAKLDEAVRQGPEPLLRELIAVVDFLDMALRTAPQGMDPGFVQGIAMTRKGLIDTMVRYGAEPIEALGAPFNPRLHEAAGVEFRLDLQIETVVEDLRRGWSRAGRVMRASLVKVGKPG